MKFIVVPRHKRNDILTLAHEKSEHLGYRKVIAMIAKHFYWPFMVREIISHCKSCDTCARCNTSGQKRAPLQMRPILSEPFEAIACDLIGPFQKGRHGYRYVLTSVCLATRWPTAIPLKNIRAGTVAQGLIETFTQTAVPDKGSQFTGKLFKNVVKLLNIENLTTTPYHPHCNGVVERLNGTVKQALTK